MTIPATPTRGWARVALLALSVWLLATTSHAQDSRRLSVVVVLDASLSMRQNDPDQLARLAARLLVDLAGARDHVTVVSFGTEATTVASERGDKTAALSSALDRVLPSDKCTDYAKGLAKAADAFKQPPKPGERRLVVFLTDGEYHPATDPKAGCTPASRFESRALKGEDRESLRRPVLAAADRLKAARAKVFVIGLGKALGRAEQSRTLLTSVAQRTDGRFLTAEDADRVPEFFADIFAGLVGAPVEKPGAGATVDLTVPKDSAELFLVVRSDKQDPGLSLSDAQGAKFPFGKPQAAARGPLVRRETGKRPRGYALYWLKDPKPGKLRLTGAGEPLRVWSIADVGTSLQLEGVPDVLPETELLKGTIALRSRHGNAVARDPSYLRQVTFTLELPGQPPRELASGGKDAVGFSLSEKLAPRPEPYVLIASARHAEGFLQVDGVRREIRVIHRFPLALTVDPIRFSTMAEPGTIATSHVRLSNGAKPPADVRIELSLAEGMARQDLRIEPASVTFGPNQPSDVELKVTFADPKSLRSEARRYNTELVLQVAADHDARVSGNKRWAAPVDGQLHAWTLARWLHEYRWQLGIGLTLLVLLIWVIGRALAKKFPPKARVHYVEVGTPFESDSLLKRYVRRGAYRSARFSFPLGKKAKPLVEIVSTGAAFEVRPAPGITVTVLAVPEDEEKRKPFRGSWQQRYRLSDRYEIWLTRS